MLAWNACPTHAAAAACRLIAGLTLAAAASAAPAAAQGYRDHHYGYGAPRYVVAESHWGNGTISAPVRAGRHGLQVRLPRGTWIDCVRSCSDTLRRETVDYWQSQGPQAPGSGRGYLRWEFRY
jgi:hypothetical protein